MVLENYLMWCLFKYYLDLKSLYDYVYWVELFYDFIYVVIIFLLGNFLSDYLYLSGFFIFVGLFIIVWFVWVDFSVFNLFYVSIDVKYWLIMVC